MKKIILNRRKLIITIIILLVLAMAKWGGVTILINLILFFLWMIGG